jgi:hypothetical protein
MAQSQPLQCLRCSAALEEVGVLPLRAGGTSGGWNFALGEWAALGERVVNLEVLRCSVCGHLEFFDLDASLPET